MIKKVAIIGAGPAGMATALQLHRFGINTILFDQNPQDSLLKNAWCVENYLGYYPGISGIRLLRQFQIHLIKNRIKTVKTKVESLDYHINTQLFKIKTREKNYAVDWVVIASGTKPKLLFENPSAAMSKHLFYEVFPLLEKRKKTILIIGAGDAAFDNALNLAKYNKVIICDRKKSSNVLPLLKSKVIKNHNISYLQEHRLCRIIFIDAKKRLSLEFINRNKNVYIKADYLLAAIGRLPQKDFYTDNLLLLEKRLIKEKKLFLVGDAKNKLYRQVAIAIGDGIKAAMNIFYDSK